jgi:16S rRNA (uracil1498-N3)-methyltransferase
MNLVLIEADEIAPDGSVTLEDRRARHIREVLGAQTGRRLRIGRLDGPLGHGCVTETAPARVRLQCVFEDETPDRPALDLLLAMPRPKAMRRLWSQLAALGVDRIAVTAARKVERGYFDSHVLRPDVRRRFLMEGLEQAADTRLPAVTVYRRFSDAVREFPDTGHPDAIRLLAEPGTAPTVRTRIVESAATRALLAVGPESGWMPEERAALVARGFTTVSLGPRILRTDTACLALMTLIHDTLSPRRAAPADQVR